MEHEHTRLDRDQYIRIYSENVIPEKMNQFRRHKSLNIQDLGSYDLRSIMHYSKFADSVNGRPTIEVINKSSAIIGNRQGFSLWDVQSIFKAYGCNQQIVKADGQNMMWRLPYPSPLGLSILQHKHHKCVIRSTCRNEAQVNQIFSLHFDSCNKSIYNRSRYYAMKGCDFRDVPMSACAGECSGPYFSCEIDQDCPSGHTCDSDGKCDVLVLSNLNLCSEHRCHHGGTCSPLYLDFKCNCTAGWGGKSCRTNVTAMGSNDMRNPDRDGAIKNVQGNKNLSTVTGLRSGALNLVVFRASWSMLVPVLVHVLSVNILLYIVVNSY